MSFPSEISLGNDGDLRFRWPVELENALAQRRQNHFCVENTEISDAQIWLEDFRDACFQIEAEFGPATAKEYGLIVRTNEENGGIYRSVNTQTQRFGAVSFAPDATQPWTLRAVVDRSVIEVIAGGRVCSTQRCYAGAEANRVAFFARGGSARLESPEIWTL